MTSQKRIYVPITQEIENKVKAIAKKERRSVAFIAAEIFADGLKLYREDIKIIK